MKKIYCDICGKEIKQEAVDTSGFPKPMSDDGILVVDTGSCTFTPIRLSIQSLQYDLCAPCARPILFKLAKLLRERK